MGPMVLGFAVVGKRPKVPFRSSGSSRSLCRVELEEELNKMAEMGRPAKAVELFHQIYPQLPAKRQKKPFVWNLVLAAFSHSGDYDGALRWFNKTREAGVPSNKKAFGKMMEAAARTQRPDLAKEWMEKLTDELGVDPDPEAISILIYAYANDGKVESANEILEQKIRSGHANLIDYNTVADAYAKRGQAKDVAIVTCFDQPLKHFPT